MPALGEDFGFGLGYAERKIRHGGNYRAPRGLGFGFWGFGFQSLEFIGLQAHEV